MTVGDRFSWPAMVHLPLIKCSFPTKQHPDYDARLRAGAEAWVLSRFGGLDTPSRKSFRETLLRKSSFHLLASLAFANSLTERMAPIYQIMAWFFLFDNFVDDPAELGARPQDAAALVARVEAVLDDNVASAGADDVEPPSSGGDDDDQSEPRSAYDRTDQLAAGDDVDVVSVIEQTAREWWDGMRRLGMPPAQQARFARLFKAYLRSTLLQVAHRRDRYLPVPAAYLHLREDAGAWHVCGLLLEYGLAIDFDPATLNHPLMRRLGAAAAAYVHLVNDLYSFPKEYREGDLLNLVPVLFLEKKKKKQLQLLELAEQQQQQPYNCSSSASSTIIEYNDEQLLHEALAELAELIQEKDAECIHLMDSIRQCSALMDQPGMALYLEGVGNWVAGNLHWSLVSARYGISSSSSLAASLDTSTRYV